MIQKSTRFRQTRLRGQSLKCLRIKHAVSYESDFSLPFLMCVEGLMNGLQDSDFHVAGRSAFSCAVMLSRLDLHLGIALQLDHRLPFGLYSLS